MQHAAFVMALDADVLLPGDDRPRKWRQLVIDGQRERAGERLMIKLRTQQ
jgi:hypothetical protein